MMIRLLPILLIGLLTACGQKGPLYLPLETKPRPAASDAAAPAAAQPASPDNTSTNTSGS